MFPLGELQDFTQGWGNFLKKVALTPFEVFNSYTTSPNERSFCPE
jgi:hypothetical protein